MLLRGNPKMLRGDILVIEGTGFYAWLIRLFTRSKWTHAALYMGNGLIAEVSAGYPVRIVPLTYDKYAVLRKPLTFEQRVAIVHWCDSQVGVGYDWPAIVSIGLRLLWGVRACLNERKRYICTELVQEAYRAADAPLARGLLTPAELAKLPGLDIVWG